MLNILHFIYYINCAYKTYCYIVQLSPDDEAGAKHVI